MSVVLLGPVRDADTLTAEVRRLRERGSPTGLPLSGQAVITAGWQDWEDHDRGLWNGLDTGVVPLALHRRAERVWAADPELAEAHHDHQQRLRLLRRSYNLRLERAADAWLALERMRGDPAVVDPERESACQAVRALDRHHLARLRELRRDFEERWRPGDREAVARERGEIAAALADVGLVLIAGGHVAVLLNRLRLFNLGPLLAARSVVAWAGGAMVLTDRVVLFHDSPPWGPGHAEVGESGLGLVPGVVVLPDAGRRLRLDDAARVGRLSRRIAPDPCLVLDPGDRVEWRDGTLHAEGVRRLAPTGALVGAGVAERDDHGSAA